MGINFPGKVIGTLLLFLGSILVLPAIYSTMAHDTIHMAFLIPAGIAIALGVLLRLFFQKSEEDVGLRTGFAVVAISWMLAGAFGSAPYYISRAIPNTLNAFFESVSGFTGTGASVLTNIEALPPSLLLWRSMTQWLGGMGIVVFFMAILPILGIRGVGLFRAEVTGPHKDRLTPRVKETAQKLWMIYVGLTAVLTVLLYYAGMSVFDAINHAMTTLSTGGFSTKNNGIQHFQSASIDYLLIAFMIIGSINYSIHYLLLAKRRFNILQDTELRWYLRILFLFTAMLVVLTWGNNYQSLHEAFRYSLFTVAATASSTGFSHTDYTAWIPGAQLLILLMMLIGGMSGSTAGGAKCIRFLVSLKHMGKELRQVIHPNAVLTVRVNQKSVEESTAGAIWGFLFLYLLSLVIITLLLALQGTDLVSSFSAGVSVLSNIGPGLGDLGPTSNFLFLPDLSKAVLCFGMILGRLEFYTLLVILTPAYWRK